MKKIFLKKLTISSVLLMAVCLLAACGGTGKSESEDILKGATYKLVKHEYKNETGETVEATIDPETATTIEFLDDGSYLETYYEADEESGDYETLSLKREVTGKYEITDGKILKLTPNAVEDSEGEAEQSDSEKEIKEYFRSGEYIIDGDTMTYEIPVKEFEHETGTINAGGFKYTFKKVD